MSDRATDRLIAEWLGDGSHVCYESWHCDDCADGSHPTPEYATDDSEAVKLLPVLVEREYWYDMSSHHNKTHTCVIGDWVTEIHQGCTYEIRHYITDVFTKPTIASAITSAVILLLEKEQQDKL